MPQRSAGLNPINPKPLFFEASAGVCVEGGSVELQNIFLLRSPCYNCTIAKEPNSPVTTYQYYIFRLFLILFLIVRGRQQTEQGPFKGNT